MKVTVCSALITKDDTVLLVHEQKMDKYGLPGGKLEEHESLKDCIIRECKEELGADIEVNGLAMVSDKPNTHEGNSVVRFFFHASITNPSSGPAELEYDFLTREQFNDLVREDRIRGKDVEKLVNDFFDGTTSVQPAPVLFT